MGSYPQTDAIYPMNPGVNGSQLLAYSSKLWLSQHRRISRRSTLGIKRMAEVSSKPVVVTLKHLAAALAEKHDIPKKVSGEILSDLIGLMTKHLKKGEKIRIGGFGVLQVRKRP